MSGMVSLPHQPKNGLKMIKNVQKFPKMPKKWPKMPKNAQKIATRQAIFAASPAEMVLPHCAAAQAQFAAVASLSQMHNGHPCGTVLQSSGSKAARSRSKRGGLASSPAQPSPGTRPCPAQELGRA